MGKVIKKSTLIRMSQYSGQIRQAEEMYRRVTDFRGALAINRYGGLKHEARELAKRLQAYDFALTSCLGFCEAVAVDIKNDRAALKEFQWERVAPEIDAQITALDDQLAELGLIQNLCRSHRKTVKLAKKDLEDVVTMQGLSYLVETTKMPYARAR